jgi:hypothetical protein
MAVLGSSKSSSRALEQKIHTLKLVFGKGDDEDPVLTLMISGED